MVIEGSARLAPLGADTTEAPLLHVANLSVVLEHHQVIEALSFSVRRGEVLAILGPNGAGKTVLLRALLGLVPASGVLQWADGVRIGYVPQRVPYVRDLPLTVEDFFTLRSRDAVDVATALREVGLDSALATQRMGVLSSGQFQRVLIAWALTGKPDILLFDEPMAGVDVGGAETVHRLLARLNRARGLTLLLVTHDVAIVHELCSSVLCLNRRPICLGAPPQVLTAEVMEQMYGGAVDYHRHAPG